MRAAPTRAGDAPRRATLELGAVAFTGALHLVFEELLHLKAPFILLALLGWGAYLGLAVRRDRDVLRRWGLRVDGLGSASRRPGLVLAAGGIALAAAGAMRGTLLFHWHMLPLLALYPLWGLAQQFMVQAMIARNLDRLLGRRGPVVILTATLFGVVHWPDPFLMAATGLLGVLFTPIYLAQRSLIPLGVAHGWLGVLAYYWLLGRDSWLELF